MPWNVDLHKLLPPVATRDAFMTVASAVGRRNASVPQVPQVASGASQQNCFTAQTGCSLGARIVAVGRNRCWALPPIGMVLCCQCRLLRSLLTSCLNNESASLNTKQAPRKFCMWLLMYYLNFDPAHFNSWHSKVTWPRRGECHPSSSLSSETYHNNTSFVKATNDVACNLIISYPLQTVTLRFAMKGSVWVSSWKPDT